MEQRTVVTIEHLTNSLAQIEYWIKAVRLALGRLDPKAEIVLAAPESEKWAGEAAILTGKNCPPPD
jgi:hypothetical protein